MQLALKQVQVGLRNSTVRIPFRYGNTCLTRCPQAVLFANIEVDGTVVEGYSGDCLPPGWFDKDPGKDFEQQISEMLSSTEYAIEVFTSAAAKSKTFFEAWRESYELQQQWGRDQELPSLLATFGLSLVERAIMDFKGEAVRTVVVGRRSIGQIRSCTAQTAIFRTAYHTVAQ